MAALLTNGSGIVLATAGGVALAVPSLEARAGARASATGTKAATSTTTARAGATGTAVGVRTATGGAQALSGARGDAGALKSSTAAADARAGLRGDAIPQPGPDVTLAATGRAGARGEAIGTAAINPADSTGAGSGGPHKFADDGVTRISMREKRDRDAAEFARRQAEERQAAQAARDAAPDVEPPAPKVSQRRRKAEAPALHALQQVGQAGGFAIGLDGLPAVLAPLGGPLDPAGVEFETQRLAAEAMAIDDEEVLALIEIALAL